MALTQEQEKQQQAALYTLQNRKKLQEGFREDMMQKYNTTTENDEIPKESVQKRRLALLKAGAVKRANQKTGQAVGRAVGGTFFSIIPFIGTLFGMLLGGFIGKKAGLIGLSIFAFFSLLFVFILLIAALKYGCETTYGKSVNTAIWLQSFGTTDICAALQ